ncbi:hypothetical protein N7539_004343 [Penicillium diatomitis]|uniref:Uncharacterized protein n=1 Tax=Penicillium diatomitis TaxID=2819901 RepID=A0A9W9XEA6_9EURO|nr:uncharacterized protein N7539_004343 [Penicillium diatomitis]KAJ5489453.1 hypothetical protein N7539_004343 [Penicillium diatomitis]
MDAERESAQVMSIMTWALWNRLQEKKRLHLALDIDTGEISRSAALMDETRLAHAGRATCFPESFVMNPAAESVQRPCDWQLHWRDAAEGSYH